MTWVTGLRRLGCPPGWKLTRAISETIDPRTEWHITRCTDCADRYAALLALAAKTKALPSPEKMSRDARDAIGARLRTQGAPSGEAVGWRRQRRVVWWLAAPIAAAALILAVRSARHASTPRGGVGLTPPPVGVAGESRASIRAIGQARFQRAQFQPDEIVRVDEGEIELEIEPLRANERFRVLTEDGEVEVRGTSFKVSVSDHRLVGVHVWRGRVEVRTRGGVFAVLEAGDDWLRDGVPVPPPPPGVEAPAARPPARAAALRLRPALAKHALAPAAPGSRALASSPPAAGRAAASGVSFGHAWSLLQNGEAKAAAAEFAEVERLAHGRDIEEDALYWRAIAVGRTADAAGARQLFDQFLERFPASARVGEAATSSGWLLLEAGDRRAARRAFERAATDPSPRVRANAQEGLRRTQEDDH